MRNKRTKLKTDNRRGNHTIMPGKICLISRGEGSQLNVDGNEEGLTENKAVHCQAAEPLQLHASVAGYITLVTQLQASEALFEPCVSTPQARVLCSGIVKLTPSSDNQRSYVTVPYLNIESECKDR